MIILKKTANKQTIKDKQKKSASGRKTDRKPSRFLKELAGFYKKDSRWRVKIEEQAKVNPVLLRICLIIFLALFLAFLAFPGFFHRGVVMKVGDIADRDIKADRDLMILDQASTAIKRAAAGRDALPVFDLNDQAASRARELIQGVFAEGRSLYQVYAAGVPVEPGGISSPPDNGALAQFRSRFNSTFGLDPQSRTFEALAQINFSIKAEQAVSQLLNKILSRGIVADRDMYGVPENKGIIVRFVFSKREKQFQHISAFLTLSQAQQMAMSGALLYRQDFKPNQIKAMVTIVRSILRPNLIPNQAETLKRRMEAVRKVAPVFFQVNRGEMIIREGERVDEMARLKLKALERARAEFDVISRLGGIFLLAIIFLGVIYITGFKRFQDTRFADRDLIFLAFILVVSLLVADAASMGSQALNRGGINLSANTLLYLVPLAAGGMVAAIFLGPIPAVLYSVSVSVLSGLILGSFILSFYYFIGAMVGVASVGHIHERLAIIKAGLLVGLVNAGMLIGLSLYYEIFFTFQTLINLGMGILNGLLAGIVVTGLTPLIEMIFGYTTNIKLMELANLDRPILRDLMVQAPGTYHHSVIVGVMVETAAEAIGANPLLAKVSAHYHDIGKLKKPLYFVENQTSGQNKHEKLAPSMSSLVLISHVKDGVELARKNKLGRDIIDIIQQHHGTSLITTSTKKPGNARVKINPGSMWKITVTRGQNRKPKRRDWSFSLTRQKLHPGPWSNLPRLEFRERSKKSSTRFSPTDSLMNAN